ncbi:MAG TPA: DUF305 domain-containing protein [Acidimicrobiales bacterium]|nr:DUF305 domain-containing protein [Acidimicrobiales bacterium]
MNGSGTQSDLAPAGVDAPPGSAGPGDVEPVAGDDASDVDDRPPGLGWGRVVVLGAALAFLGLAVGLFASRDRPPGAGSVDVGFLEDMLTHHEQALGVATLEVAYGQHPTVRSYARDVLTSQAYEQGRMTQILADWGYSRSTRPARAMAWMDMPVPVEEMPGLLSEGQMDQVRDARGAALDALFLELMAEHHRGGLHMASAAAGAADDGDVRDLATRMGHAQAVEINEYRRTAQRMGLDVDIPAVDVPPAD